MSSEGHEEEENLRGKARALRAYSKMCVSGKTLNLEAGVTAGSENNDLCWRHFTAKEFDAGHQRGPNCIDWHLATLERGHGSHSKLLWSVTLSSTFTPFISGGALRCFCGDTEVPSRLQLSPRSLTPGPLTPTSPGHLQMPRYSFGQSLGVPAWSSPRTPRQSFTAPCSETGSVEFRA